MNDVKSRYGERKGEIIRNIYAKYGMWIILLGMIILMMCLSDRFLSPNNILNLVRQVSFIAIIGFGSAMVLICGGLDLSPGALMAVVSVVSASFAQGEYPVIVAILVGLAVGLAAVLPQATRATAIMAAMASVTIFFNMLQFSLLYMVS